jgi:hypothetical protein
MILIVWIVRRLIGTDVTGTMAALLPLHMKLLTTLMMYLMPSQRAPHYRLQKYLQAKHPVLLICYYIIQGMGQMAPFVVQEIV